jgi:hypothetical protein
VIRPRRNSCYEGLSLSQSFSGGKRRIVLLVGYPFRAVLLIFRGDREPVGLIFEVAEELRALGEGLSLRSYAVLISLGSRSTAFHFFHSSKPN